MTTALLVVDAQESFVARADDWATISAPDIADRIGSLVEVARSRGDRVVWVLHTEPGTGTVFDPDGGHVRLLPGLKPADDEPVFTKTAHNAFTGTGVGADLVAHGVNDIVVSGIRTEQCCETTARVGSDLGYGVRFVLDATATMPLPVWGSDRVLSTDEVQARTASALHGRFAEVVMLADELARA